LVKKILLVSVALLAMVAFVSGVGAQKPETPAATPKAEKPKAPKVLKAKGTVAAYDEMAKTLKLKMKVKGKEEEKEFAIADDAKIKGEVKEGAKATVKYKKEGDKMIATSISVPPPKKPKAEKPKEELK
jgi:multidrug efflux pump subunit AcrA (membrane-fusion protein)